MSGNSGNTPTAGDRILKTLADATNTAQVALNSELRGALNRAKNYPVADWAKNPGKMFQDISENKQILQDFNTIYDGKHYNNVRTLARSSYGDQFVQTLDKYRPVIMDPVFQSPKGRAYISETIGVGSRFKNAKNKADAIFSDQGRHDLSFVHRLLNNNEYSPYRKWFKYAAPELYSTLESHRDRVNHAYDNYHALHDAYSFSKSPLSWLLSAIFSSNPNRLYRFITTANSMFTPGSEFNAYYGKHMPDVDKYAGYLPWLNLAGNFRSAIAGDDISFESPAEQIINSNSR